MNPISSMSIECRFLNEETIVVCNGIRYIHEKTLTSHDQFFWLYLAVYIVLVLLTGLLSGLAMGLHSLDIMSLQVLKDAGDATQRKYAARVLPLIKNHHLLLVTLSLANTVVIETMPVFLNKISDSVTAIFVSVTAVLFIGEVLPQALCTRYALAIGGIMAPFVWFLIVIFFIVAWPVSKLLDCLLGSDHGTFYKRAELKSLVEFHGKDHVTSEGSETGGETGKKEPLSHEEVLIIKGALDMRQKSVKDAFIPMQSVFMLSMDTVLDRETMERISLEAYSRIPVFEATNSSEFVALLIVKQLIICDLDNPVSLRKLWEEHSPALIPINYVDINMPLYDLLNQFQTGKSHLCIVIEVPAKNAVPAKTVYQSADMADTSSMRPGPKAIGIITLEDVIEELIQEEIIDDDDIAADAQRRIQVARAMYARKLYSGKETKKESKEHPPIVVEYQSVNDDDQQSHKDDSENCPLIPP